MAIKEISLTCLKNELRNLFLEIKNIIKYIEHFLMENKEIYELRRIKCQVITKKGI